jgi:diguanylate cyclase (GGDEF)-like protein/PAS domain S-box-containing protein
MLDTDGAVIEWNPSIGRLFGKSEGQGAGEQLLDWVAHDAAEDPVPPFSELRAALHRQGCVQLRLPWHHAGGQVLWGDCVVTPLIESDGDVSGFVAVVRDVTEDHLRQQQLIGEARNDPLTGVCNRRGLELKALTLAEPSSASATRPAWIMIDIDHFKLVNDRYGHPSGDRVLKAVASALQSVARGDDLLARFGGEEFVLLLSATTESLALGVAERLRQRVEALSITTDVGPVRVTASFGVAMQAPGESWVKALDRADAALYRAKGAGRNQVQFAEPEVAPAS